MNAADPGLRPELLHADPLLDCLVEVCRLHGQGCSRAALAAGLPLVQGRLTLALAERAAARAGMATRLVRSSPDAIDPAALPAVLLLKNNGACVLLGRDAEGRARVLLPETGQGAVSLPAAELAARHTGLVLHVRPHFRFDAGAPAAPAAAASATAARRGHWFWSAIWSQRLVYRDVLAAAALVNLCALALPVFTMNVYDRCGRWRSACCWRSAPSCCCVTCARASSTRPARASTCSCRRACSRRCSGRGWRRAPSRWALWRPTCVASSR
jgi:ATP-binding cassette subfamily C protein LapB